MVELADSLDSGSSAHYGRAGSSPASRTISSGHKGFHLGPLDFSILIQFDAGSRRWPAPFCYAVFGSVRYSTATPWRVSAL